MNRYLISGALASVVGLLYAPPVLAVSQTMAPNVIRLNQHIAFYRLPHTPFYLSHSVTRNLEALSVHDGAKRLVSIVVDSPNRIAALQAYSQAVNIPGSPDFHHYLTPTELDRKFGPNNAMLQQATTALREAGWTVTGHQGLVVDAVIPAHLASPGLPVAPSIWSVAGLTPIHTVHNAALVSHATPKASTGTVRAVAKSSSGIAASLTATYGLQQNPVFVASQTGSSGDTLFAMSWNPGFISGIPAGLPWTLALAAETANGTPLTITNVTAESDAANNVGVFTYSNTGYGAVFPGSNGTLWQIEAEAFGNAPSGDTLSLTVTLGDGSTQNLVINLPAFTGTANALNTLTGPQLNTIVGATQIAKSSLSGRPPVAIYCQGQIPSNTDLASLLSQEGLPMPTVSYQYFDGATASMINSGDAVESNLDIQAIASVDPGATIDEYVYPASTDTDTFVAMLTTLSQQTSIKIASFSYGFFGENSSTVAALVAACNAEGITLIDGSGDNGAWETGSDPGPVGVESNDGQPGITTVGGLNMAAPAVFDASGNMTGVSGPAIAKAWGGDYLNGLPLIVAEDYTAPNAASTGGFGVGPIPSWQNGFLPSTATGIGVPDISSLAGAPGFTGEYQGQQTAFGGTSLAAPLTAGWLADAESFLGVGGSGMGNINPLIFRAASQHPSDFIQALWGANGAYTVTSPNGGTWNPVTGLGQPRWDLLAALWNPSNVNSISITTSTTSATVGQPVTYSVTAFNGNNTVASYNGILKLSSSDPHALYPSEITLSDGKGAFSVTYSTAGEQTMTATDAAQSPAVSATATPISVSASFNVSASSTAVTAGHSVTLTAQGSGLLSPLYQFWIYDPATQQWSSSGAYRTSSTYGLNEAVPGTYTIIVYAKSATGSGPLIQATNSVNYVAAAGKPMVSNLTVTSPAIAETVGANITVSATASDSGGTPEYQFWVHGPNNKWEMVQNYSPVSTFSLSNLQSGSYVIAAYALDLQQVKNGDWTQAYYNDTFINVNSNVSLSGPASGTIGATMNLTASAVGLTNPVYQFWIENPQGHWVSSGGYGNPAYAYVPQTSGSYTVIVYAKDPYAPATAQYAISALTTFTVP